MPDQTQYAINDRNKIPGQLIHSGTANSADLIRRTGQSSGAANVHITGGTIDVDTSVTPYQLQMDGTTTANVTYVGQALPGSATSSACWQIKKIDETTTDILTIKWAGTSTAFDQVWSDRGTLSYG